MAARFREGVGYYVRAMTNGSILIAAVFAPVALVVIPAFFGKKWHALSALYWWAVTALLLAAAWACLFSSSHNVSPLLGIPAGIACLFGANKALKAGTDFWKMARADTRQ